MTSGKLSERRFTKIDTWDPWTRPHFLSEDDECYHYGEYTPGAGYSFGETNDFISNFKKDLDRRGRSEWRYKERAIQQAGSLIAQHLRQDWLRTATLVPIPPSKARGDPLYDDRLLRMLRAAESAIGSRLDIRELLYQSESTRASSQSDFRVTLEELQEVYRIDESLSEPMPKQIGLFDDLISAGRHFRVAKELLQQHFPRISVIGFFLARTLQRPPPGETDGSW